MMAVSIAKENIKPLQQENQDDQSEKRKYERLIKAYEGNDPLALWYEYIGWIEQSSFENTENVLNDVILKCIICFENDIRYKQDRRMVKLYIKYIDTQKEPQNFYNKLYQNGVGTLVADLYIAWSYYFDVINNHKEVHAIFQKGFDAGAQPKEDLTKAHNEFSISMSKRLLNHDEHFNQQFQATMKEKRLTFISIQENKKSDVANGKPDVNVKVLEEKPLTANVVAKKETKSVDLFETGIILPMGFVSRNKVQKPWTNDIPIVVNEPIVTGAVPCYEKFLLYPNEHTEISADEYRGYKWFKDRGMANQLTLNYDSKWENKFETKIRIPPGFASKNVKQVEKDDFKQFIYEDQHDNIQVPIKKIYPEEGEEMSLEELLSQKFKSGGIKVLTEDDFDVVSDNDLSDMDMTIITERRQSIYPNSRKSFVPRKSLALTRKSSVEEILVEESSVKTFQVSKECSVETLKKSTIIKRKFEEISDSEDSSKRGFVAQTPPRSSFETFKQPLPVGKKSIRPFDVDDADMTGFGACSTQQFNFFIKQQAVSTPVMKKTVPRLVPLAMEKEYSPESVSSCHVQEIGANKQLSIIMETTRPSKSSGSQTSSKILQRTVMRQQIEEELFNPVVPSFRMPEEQTETCANIILPLVNIATLNAFEAKEQEIERPNDELMIPPPLDEDLTMKLQNIALTSELLQQSGPQTAINLPTIQENPEVPSNNIEKEINFDIYEDSVMNIPKLETSNALKIPNDEGTGLSHVSRKENFVVSPPLTTLKSNSIKNASKLSIEEPRGPTPTLFVDDLNTEKFVLGNLKNSTLIATDGGKKHEEEKVCGINLSIEVTEDEMTKLRDEDVFKVPTILAPKTKPFEIYNDNEAEEEKEEDFSKSIYVQRDEKLDLEEEGNVEWNYDPTCSFIADDFNQYEHTILPEAINMSLEVQKAIQLSYGNPFDEKLRTAMLDHCNFSRYLEDNIESCSLLKNIPKLKSGIMIEIAGGEYKIFKTVGKGNFGTVFTAENKKTKEIVALKQEKPANLWEYYICVELSDRLKNRNMLSAFMTIDGAIIANNSSILMSKFSPYGSIIEVCNKHKKTTNKNIDEYVVMVLTSQILSIIDHLHGCKIIHADIKPDNFLLMSKIEYGMKVPALQLIDFGSAIDMDWYEKGATFNYVVKTENFTCCEMLEKKEWTYQTDLFGLVGTAHVMLFGKYMEVEKKGITWNIKSHFPRYFAFKIMWEQFFNILLNISNCNSMPNLQDLKDQFEAEIRTKKKFVLNKIEEFNRSVQ
ncbi:CLUMA_CG012058, isoform A [Clunio marinus]|uniref:CLUMA_CG012058, isoform A n=1 Tax=Clunio marinus TaxID=568069 RepID=A0A1J1IIT4_9DIPT|nr:CLUMA_CG012058, isoform A [Clunio marinus]